MPTRRCSLEVGTQDILVERQVGMAETSVLQ